MLYPCCVRRWNMSGSGYCSTTNRDPVEHGSHSELSIAARCRGSSKVRAFDGSVWLSVCQGWLQNVQNGLRKGRKCHGSFICLCPPCSVQSRYATKYLSNIVEGKGLSLQPTSTHIRESLPPNPWNRRCLLQYRLDHGARFGHKKDA